MRKRGTSSVHRLALLEVLLELGVPSKQTNYFGETTLHLACSTWFGDIYDQDARWEGIIDLLLGPKSNTDINEADKKGIRAVHLAATLSDRVLRWLVERGADPTALTGEGQTPLQVACRAR